jgi:ketosteroid isomerase-like protein
MAETNNAADITDLKNINNLIGQAELERNPESIRSHLADDMIFLRAKGEATKEQYLDGLTSPDNTNDVLEWNVVNVSVNGDHAIAMVDVRLVGTRNKNKLDGEFRNIRTFVKRDGQWQLLTWGNAQTKDNLPKPE